MYRAPESFVERLDEEFGGRLRVRWSGEKQKFVIEQKVRRGIVGPPPFNRMKGTYDFESDTYIGARDGVMQVMEFQPGDRMACPRCAATVKVPTRSYAMVSCDMCRVKGYEHRFVGGFWPMDETLIDYLKSIDPLRGRSEKIRQHVDLSNQKNMQRLVNEGAARTTDKFNEDFRRIVGIPSVGYTGKIFNGTEI